MTNKSYTRCKGHKFYLEDDCETLLVKLQNIETDYYLHNEPCDIDRISKDIELLEKAIEERDINAMQNILDNNRTLFKRYQ